MLEGILGGRDEGGKERNNSWVSTVALTFSLSFLFYFHHQ